MEQFLRPRRMRRNEVIRELSFEHTLQIKRLIQPYFVCEGDNIKDEINSLPGIYRESPDIMSYFFRTITLLCLLTPAIFANSNNRLVSENHPQEFL